MNGKDTIKQIILKTISLLVFMSTNKSTIAFDLVPYEQNTQPTIPSNYFSPIQNSYFPIRSAETEIKSILNPAKKDEENRVNRKQLDTYSGTNWNLDTSTGKLTISGPISVSSLTCYHSGGCYAVDSPWKSYRDYIKYVEIENSVTNSVTNIDNYNRAFIGCSNLISITVDSNNPNYKSINGVLFNKAGTTLVSYPNGKSGSYTMPSSVTSIGSYAFCSCLGLTSVTIPNSVTSIEREAFFHCDGLTSVTIGSGVTSIGSEAFAWCKGLTSVTIPNSVTKIDEHAFYYSSGLTSINVDASNANYKSMNGILYSKDGKTLIRCPEGKTGSVTIPNSVTSIGSSAFRGCSGLTSITIPNSVTSIGNNVFYGCDGLTSVTIPNSVTSIGSNAFCSCDGLTSVTIGSGVTKIGSSAFAYCDGLTSVTFTGTIEPKFDSSPFSNCNNLNAIEVSDKYKKDTFCGINVNRSLTVVPLCGDGKQQYFDSNAKKIIVCKKQTNGCKYQHLNFGRFNLNFLKINL